MCMLHRFYNAVVADRERKRRKLERLFKWNIPYYDTEYEHLSLDKFIELILRVTNGKIGN